MKNKKLSIRIIFPLIMSVTIVVCMISCMVLSVYGLSKYFISETVEEIGKQNDSLGQGIENEIEEINELVNTVYYKNIKQYDFADERFSETLHKLLNENAKSVHRIALYDMYGNCIWPSEYVPDKPVNCEEWFEHAIDNIEIIYIGSVKAVYDEIPKRVFQVSRYIEYADHGIMKSGVMHVQYYTDSMERIIDSYKNKMTDYCYLMDENRRLIFHPFMRLIQSGLYEERTLEDIQECEDYLVETYEDNQWIIEKQQIGYTGWNIVIVNSLSNVHEENVNVYYITWLAFLLVGLILIFFDILLFRMITDPIYQLMHTMNEFGKGNYQEKAKEAGIGELKSLSEHFNHMADKIQLQMDEILKNEREKQKMEKKLLQSQINPHFLYNTLDSIIWMIQSEEYAGAGQMVSLLAKFFRVSLSQGKDMIPLEKELEHATSYLAIQNIRFKDKFEFSVHADETLMKYLCPKLSVQPLLENAIYHGMEGMYEDGEITINVYEKENVIHIDVTDNGPGMSAEKVEYIMNNQVVSSKRGSGIGVRNVNERIKLIYGKEYGVSVVSELDEGTTATIMIPKLEETDEK